MCYFRSMACRLRKVVIPLATSVILAWDLLSVQEGCEQTGKNSLPPKHTACEERLRKTVLFSLVSRRLMDDLMVSYVKFEL